MSPLENRHPYLVAKELFLSNRITRCQAIGMVARDPEWIAECDLSLAHGNETPLSLAREVVNTVWTKQLVALHAAVQAGYKTWKESK